MNFEYEPNFIDAQLAYAKSQAAKKAKAKAQKPPYWLNTAKLSAKIHDDSTHQNNAKNSHLDANNKGD